MKNLKSAAHFGPIRVYLTIDKVDCGNMGEHECQISDKKASNTILKFRSQEEHAFAILHSNREARGTLTSYLPCRLPSADPTVSIRFDPKENQIFITNGDKLLYLMWDMVSSFVSNTLKTLCINSYIGQNITTLILHAKNIWGNNLNSGIYEDGWVSVFKHLFPNLDRFTVGYIDDEDDNCRFEDLDHEYYNNSDSDYDLEYDSEDSDDEREWKEERLELASKREDEGPPPVIEDKDKLTEMIGDFMANAMDGVEKDDPSHFQQKKKPECFALHARDVDVDVELEKLAVRHPAHRTDFEAWNDRFDTGHWD